MLNGSRHAEFFPGRLGEGLQGVEVELHLGDASVGQNHAAVGGARLDTDLADPLETLAALCQLFQVAAHEGPELPDGAVLAAHLSDLATHGYLNALGLDLAD